MLKHQPLLKINNSIHSKQRLNTNNEKISINSFKKWVKWGKNNKFTRSHKTNPQKLLSLLH